MQWLHKRLETYPIPKAITGRITPAGIIPKRLQPIFRDRDELSASNNLGETIEAALASSENLIIICSPAAAKSKWVNQEVLTFKRNNRDAQLFSVIVKGEPYASGIPGREDEECFPPALRYDINSDGSLSNTLAEPLAADFRQTADGKRLGLLKLVSGMLGIGLDEIVQRDMKRSRKRVTAITSGSLATVLVMGSLTWFATDAKQEAEMRRTEAEGLIEYMLTDLRSKLEPVGRLDILGDVASQAIQYYDGKENLKLSCKGVSGRARAHYLNTRILGDKGNWDQAAQEANRAMTIMTARAQECLDDPRFIISYAHAQQWAVEPIWSVVNSTKKKNLTPKHHKIANGILSGYEDSRRTLENLAQHTDYDFQYAMEMAAADMLIGRLFTKLDRMDDAGAAFSQALDHMRRFRPGNENGQFDTLTRPKKIRALRKHADITSWNANIQEDAKNFIEALKLYEQSRVFYARLAGYHGDNGVDWVNRFDVVASDYSRARVESKMGNFYRARDIIVSASGGIEPLLEHDPENKSWRDFAARLDRTQEKLNQIINQEEGTP